MHDLSHGSVRVRDTPTPFGVGYYIRSIAGLYQVCLKSVSGLSQIYLRSISGLSQVYPRFIPGLCKTRRIPSPGAALGIGVEVSVGGWG